MRLSMVPENLAERLIFLSGILPPAIIECWFGTMLARTVMAATKLDIFESLAAGHLTADEVAQRCGTHQVNRRAALASPTGARARSTGAP